MRHRPLDKRLKIKIPYSYKMMVPYLLLVLMTDLLIGFYSYSSLVQSRTEMAESNLRTGILQTKNQFEFQIGEIQRMSESLFKDRSFNEALETEGTPFEIYLLMLDQIVPALQSPLQQFGNPIQLVIYPLNSTIMKIYGNDLLKKPIKTSEYFIVPVHEVKDADWFAALSGGGMDGRWLQVEADQELENLSYVHRLISYQDYQTAIGYARIVIRLEDLVSNFGAFPLDQGIRLSLEDETNGAVLFQRGVDELDADDSPIILKEKIAGTNYFIKVAVPDAYLKKDSRKLQAGIATVCTVSFLIMTAIGLFVAHLSGRKMRYIVKQVRSLYKGNIEKKIRISEYDEFGQIAEAINAMEANIQKLIHSVYLEGVRKKQAELEALQAQINPHFLYNTLSSIISLANLGEIDKVTDMVNKMTLFYRLSLNEGEVDIPLEKELEQVKAYIDIQRTKYENAFTVYYDIQAEIISCSVIKLILQPFVENIFKHAWYGKSIAVIIKGRIVEDGIELKVIDNGIGIHREAWKSLKVVGQRQGGYGIQNVDERIKLRYGQQYGVNISSIYGAGTTACILLPAKDAPLTLPGENIEQR